MGNDISAFWDYCEAMLPQVSRTFSLNIQRLEGTLYQAVLVGYLLFRMADTLEDSPILSEEEKIHLLTNFLRLFSLSNPGQSYLSGLNPLKKKVEENSPEGDLMIHGDRVFTCYSHLPAPHRAIIANALRESLQGMVEYQRRKRAASQGICQLRDDHDLIRYCYYVAGVVGKMLTELFCLEEGFFHLHSALSNHQIHFGIGLQMTNIAKDYPKDLERGWCYLPQTLTDRLNITVQDLIINPALKRQEISLQMIQKVLPHLDGAYRYIATLPIPSKRIRLFCIIPFTLAYHTLAHLFQTQEEKLPRGHVHQILSASEIFCHSNAALREDYEKTLKHLVSSTL